MIAIGNSGKAELADAARRALDDASPLVRGAAVWALSRLLPREDFAALAARRAEAEPDPLARAEWAANGR
jgi:epoxyqueuosine reductase